MKLRPLKLVPYTTNEIRPLGWLKKELEIQANGLSGNLDKIWPDIRDSKWIGGDREGWERVPYWLDGFIPLSYLVQNEDMKARAKRYIDAIIARQQEDGWICPCADEERKTYDIWAAFLLGKVFVLYYECSGDPRIEEVVYKMLKSIDRHIERATIFDWAAMRWYEALIPIYWLYDRCQEEWLIQLAIKLAAEGTDYKKLYTMLSYEKRPEKKYWDFLNHVVNQAMAIKSEGLFSRISGENPGEFADKMVSKLFEKHGTVVDHFNGDECLSGKSPIQGTELCGVVEAMYSYEHLIALTGDMKWADLLERIAFNAFPATISPDMWTHQYDQLVNQPECVRIPGEDVHFTSNSGESHIFGLEPNFGCCTANFNQAWPKFCLSVFMKHEEGISIPVLAPAQLNTVYNDVPVRCTVEGDYPFRNNIKITIDAEKEVEMSLFVRIPGFAKIAYVKMGDNEKKELKGEMGKLHRIHRKWNGSYTIEVSFEFETEMVDRPNDMKAVRRGPLVYSIRIEEEWQEIKDNDIPMRELHQVEAIRKSVEHVFPYCDYEIKAKSPWNYAYVSMPYAYEEREVGEYPFSPVNSPVSMKIKAVPIEWESKNGICAEIPGKVCGKQEEITLIPYGCTNIRMTEVPFYPEKD